MIPQFIQQTLILQSGAGAYVLYTNFTSLNHTPNLTLSIQKRHKSRPTSSTAPVGAITRVIGHKLTQISTFMQYRHTAPGKGAVQNSFLDFCKRRPTMYYIS